MDEDWSAWLAGLGLVADAAPVPILEDVSHLLIDTATIDAEPGLFGERELGAPTDADPIQFDLGPSTLMRLIFASNDKAPMLDTAVPDEPEPVAAGAESDALDDTIARAPELAKGVVFVPDQLRRLLARGVDRAVTKRYGTGMSVDDMRHAVATGQIEEGDWVFAALANVFSGLCSVVLGPGPWQVRGVWFTPSAPGAPPKYVLVYADTNTDTGPRYHPVRPVAVHVPVLKTAADDEELRRILPDFITLRRLLTESVVADGADKRAVADAADSRVWRDARLLFALPPDRDLDRDPTASAWDPENVGAGLPPAFPDAPYWPPAYRPTDVAMQRFRDFPGIGPCDPERFAVGECLPDPDTTPPTGGPLSAEALFDFVLGGSSTRPASGRTAPIRRAFLQRVLERELAAIGTEVRDQAVLLRERLPPTAPFPWPDCVPAARRAGVVPASFSGAIPPVRAAFVAVCHCHNTDALAVDADTGALAHWPADADAEGHRPLVVFLDYTASPRWAALGLDRPPYLAVWPLRVVPSDTPTGSAGAAWAERLAVALRRSPVPPSGSCRDALVAMSAKENVVLPRGIAAAACAWFGGCRGWAGGPAEWPVCPTLSAWVGNQPREGDDMALVVSDRGRALLAVRRLLSLPIARLVALGAERAPVALAFVHAAVAAAFDPEVPLACPFEGGDGEAAWRTVLAARTLAELTEALAAVVDDGTREALGPTAAARAATIARASDPTWLYHTLFGSGRFTSEEAAVVVDLAMQARDDGVADPRQQEAIRSAEYGDCLRVIRAVCSPELSAIADYRARRSAAVALRPPKPGTGPFVLPARPASGSGSAGGLYALASGWPHGPAHRDLDFDRAVAYRDLAGRLALALASCPDAARLLTDDLVVRYAEANGYRSVDAEAVRRGNFTHSVVSAIGIAAACVADQEADRSAVSRPADVCRFCREYEHEPWPPRGADRACCAECRESGGRRHSAGLCWVAGKGGHPRAAVAPYQPSTELQRLLGQDDEVRGVVDAAAALLKDPAHADAKARLARTGRARLVVPLTALTTVPADLLARRLVLVREAVAALTG